MFPPLQIDRKFCEWIQYLQPQITETSLFTSRRQKWFIFDTFKERFAIWFEFQQIAQILLEGTRRTASFRSISDTIVNWLPCNCVWKRVNENTTSADNAMISRLSMLVKYFRKPAHSASSWLFSKYAIKALLGIKMFCSSNFFYIFIRLSENIRCALLHFVQEFHSNVCFLCISSESSLQPSWHGPSC